MNWCFVIISFRCKKILFATCILPPRRILRADDFIGVVEEATLAELLPALADSLTPGGSSLPRIPSALLVLPGELAAPFSPAALNPQAEYAPEAARSIEWNAGGLDLLGLTLPSAVFLVPADLAGEVRAKAQRNDELVRFLASPEQLCRCALCLYPSLARLSGHEANLPRRAFQRDVFGIGFGSVLRRFWRCVRRCV